MKVRFLKDVEVYRLTAGKENIFDAKVNGKWAIKKGQVLKAMENDTHITVYTDDMCAILRKNDSFEILTEKEEMILDLCKKTGFDEIAVGCFLSNYGMPQHICPPFSNGWCKNYEKCRVLEKIAKEEQS